jgi:hypothetical protein
VWSIFAAFQRAFGRGPAPQPQGGASAPFEAAWADWIRRAGLPAGALCDIATTGTLAPHFHYRRFFKPKRDGGRRELAEPDPTLKRIQYEIISRYFGLEQIHPAAVAYQRGKSTADHIWAHAGAQVIVLADIEDFFPNTRAARIEDWWRGRVDDDTARLLTILTTDRGGLPQGAPTSPGLSNFVNRELDAHLTQRAAVAGARYTRYCDDLAFSWAVGWGPPSGFEPGVRAALNEFGYTLHPAKGWLVSTRRDEPEVTGAVLARSGGVRVPERLQRAMRALARSSDPRTADRLRGYEGYAAMITRRPKRQPPAPAPPAGPLGAGRERAPTPARTAGEDDIPF